jgi:hypothetical protein
VVEPQTLPQPKFDAEKARDLLPKTTRMEPGLLGKIVQEAIGWGGGYLGHHLGFGPFGVLAGKYGTDKALESLAPYIQGVDRLVRPGNDTIRTGLLDRALEGTDRYGNGWSGWEPPANPQAGTVWANPPYGENFPTNPVAGPSFAEGLMLKAAPNTTPDPLTAWMRSLLGLR